LVLLIFLLLAFVLVFVVVAALPRIIEVQQKNFLEKQPILIPFTTPRSYILGHPGAIFLATSQPAAP